MKTKKKYEYETFSREWELEASALARAYCPPIYDCKKCGYPVISGYCCTYCGDSDPEHKED